MTTDNALSAVFAEIRRARDLHGEVFMGNLKRVHNDDWTMDLVIEAGDKARKRLEDGDLSKFDVLLEEVGELAMDLSNGHEATEELIHVAAMALAWLGVEPDVEDVDDFITIEDGDRPIITSAYRMREEDMTRMSAAFHARIDRGDPVVALHTDARIIGVIKPPRQAVTDER